MAGGVGGITGKDIDVLVLEDGTTTYKFSLRQDMTRRKIVNLRISNPVEPGLGVQIPQDILLGAWPFLEMGHLNEVDLERVAGRVEDLVQQNRVAVGGSAVLKVTEVTLIREVLEVLGNQMGML